MVHAPLPVFFRPVPIERHSSSLAPPSRNHLHSDSSYMEPDTPSSTQPLIGQHSGASTNDTSAADMMETSLMDNRPHPRGLLGAATAAMNMFTFDSVHDDDPSVDDDVEQIRPLINHIQPAERHQRDDDVELSCMASRGQSDEGRKKSASKLSEQDGGLRGGDSRQNASCASSPAAAAMPDYSNVNLPPSLRDRASQQMAPPAAGPVVCNGTKPKTRSATKHLYDSPSAVGSRHTRDSSDVMRADVDAASPLLVDSARASLVGDAVHPYANAHPCDTARSALAHDSDANKRALVHNTDSKQDVDQPNRLSTHTKQLPLEANNNQHAAAQGAK